MHDNVYKITEIVGTSHESSDDAIRRALVRARQSIRNVRWFEVAASRGLIDADGLVQFQVTLKVGFTLDG